MKVSELRVGNYVDYFSDNTDQWLQHRQLSENDLSCLLADNDDHATPIPLTPEWLERFGYTEISDDFYSGCFGNEYEKHRIFSQTGKAYGGFNVHFVKSNYGNIDESDIVARWNGDSLRSIQYVHQLQNLYFALTGEELLTKELGQ